MLFNSHIFLLVFLPLTVVGFYLTATNRAMRSWLLICASLVFYGYWDVRLVPLLLGSICVNWMFARLTRAEDQRWIVPLGGGVVLNLLVLAVFKYADFFAGSLAAIIGGQHQAFNIVLPLGISFFTFQQISYLVDRVRGTAPAYGFRDYFLYVAFFPQLIAGPVVRHNEIIHQFALSPLREGVFERISRGSFLMVIGLVKKVIIADELAKAVDPVFAKAATQACVGTIDAWVAALGFSLQIYFDFSGFSDIAIGVALILGFTLPLNFNSPYKASTIREFWRRWHMTLSRFLRDYLYIPLGGNRRASGALAVTMLLGGLWHGAAWTFVIWGGLHGGALALNHLWIKVGRRLPMPLGWLLTMLFVVSAFVVFRAETLGAAQVIFGGMLFMGEVGELPETRTAALLAVALLLVLVFPPSQKIALELLSSQPAYAAISAVALTLVIIFVGTGQNAEFIYFQF